MAPALDKTETTTLPEHNVLPSKPKTRKLPEHMRRVECPNCHIPFVGKWLIDVVKCNRCGYDRYVASEKIARALAIDGSKRS